jgi:hypothetical protein
MYPQLRHLHWLCVSSVLTAGCASNPDQIQASYVSSFKYQEFTCPQIGMEMEHVSARTSSLYSQLKRERNADNWQTGVGLVLFWPALFFLEGGDGPQAAEFSQLKGEFEALRQTAVAKQCTVTARSPEAIMEEAAKQEREEAERARAKQPLKS